MGPSKRGVSLVTLIVSIAALTVAYRTVDENDARHIAEKEGHANSTVTNKQFVFSTCGKQYLALVTVKSTGVDGRVRTVKVCVGHVQAPRLYDK